MKIEGYIVKEVWKNNRMYVALKFNDGSGDFVPKNIVGVIAKK